jgi:hypothetical protein
MKLVFSRKLVAHNYGTTLMKNVSGSLTLSILHQYLDSEMGYIESCNRHLEAINKIRNDEITGWGEGGNSCTSSITKNGVTIEDDYLDPPENNTLSLSLDQFEKSVIGWKKFLEDESLTEYEIDL